LAQYVSFLSIIWYIIDLNCVTSAQIKRQVCRVSYGITYETDPVSENAS